MQALDRLDPGTAACIIYGNHSGSGNEIGPLLPQEDRQKVFRALFMASGLTNHDAVVVAGLVKLTGLAWWKRMWMVQEIALAGVAESPRPPGSQTGA
ncbi:cf1203a2-f3ae-47a3-bbe4-a13eee78b919 [Thermothielavioides terrestris]|uniref:Cf1203a2-f3ae-47a3-bbe4-a13eee78b919 n=1 Tax=Thermothielavioides terrestris TaxID=2587410 RepID=A0A3S5CXH7_9PEZI|nr:cf1203a2-f3ae-47a3-bbe4-a13eee78b919 [Thermothielavioides terrestris]